MKRRFITLLIISLLATSVVTQAQTQKVTRKNWMDNNSLKAIDDFEYGDYCLDYSVAITRAGKVYIKKNSLDNDPGILHSWTMDKIVSAWQINCWKDSNKCVIAGHGQLELWLIDGKKSALVSSFKYADKNSIGSNKFEAVLTIPGTDYFLAGDHNDNSVTRWLANNNQVVAEYQVGIQAVNKECEAIV